jgi:hypothetical protein
MMASPNDPATTTVRLYRGNVMLIPLASDPTQSYLAGLGSNHDKDCPQDEDTPLSAQLAAAAARYGSEVSIRYLVGAGRRAVQSNNPLNTDWVTHGGNLESGGSKKPGPEPGKWVMHERIRVGGEDLIAELRKHAGQFIHMEVTYLR